MRNILRPGSYFKHQNPRSPDQASRAQRGRRNQWHFKPHQTGERGMGLQPVFLWRCSKSTWKQGVEEALCSGGDTHGPESKWLIFKHPFESVSVCVWVLNLKSSLWWACKCESSTVCLMPFYVYTPSVGVCALVFFFFFSLPLRSLVQLCKKPLTRYLSHTAGPPQQRLVVRASLYSVI